MKRPSTGANPGLSFEADAGPASAIEVVRDLFCFAPNAFLEILQKFVRREAQRLSDEIVERLVVSLGEGQWKQLKDGRPSGQRFLNLFSREKPDGSCEDVEPGPLHFVRPEFDLREKGWT